MDRRKGAEQRGGRQATDTPNAVRRREDVTGSMSYYVEFYEESKYTR